MAKTTLKINGLNKSVAGHKYAFAGISTTDTNASEIAVDVVAFDDFSEVAGEFEEDEIEEMKKMVPSEVFFNENGWLFIKIK